jgi:FKBP-type peptidyl-prolyl cis-trans isomerase
MKIAQGDTVESVRIVRVGAKAEAFHPTTESFQAELHAAQQRVTEHVALKKTAESEWVQSHYPKATGVAGGVLSEQLVAGKPDDSKSAVRVRYHGSEIRYMGHVIGRTGPPIDVLAFGSDEKGVPVYIDTPQAFTVQPGVTRINPGLDSIIAAMQPGERRIVIVPAPFAYGRAGTYPPEVPGKRRFVVSPNAMLVYDVEVLEKP